MTCIAVDLFNFQDGGLRSDGSYDFVKLQHAFAPGESPALILLCEAKRYGENGKAGLLGAADALSEELGREYVAELGWCDRGPFGPAIFYDPQALKLLRWHGRSEYADKHNQARFRVHESDVEFLCIVQHWDNRSGARRRQEAELIDRYGEHELPVLVGGDLNCTASGPHLPPRDWMAAEYRARSHKGRLDREDGRWVADTDAIDHLIGRWDAEAGRRVDGCGFQAVSELAWQANVPAEVALCPTVNGGVDAGGPQLIDWVLINRHMAKFLLPDSYRVHVPDGRLPAFSDHRRVSTVFDM